MSDEHTSLFIPLQTVDERYMFDTLIATENYLGTEYYLVRSGSFFGIVPPPETEAAFRAVMGNYYPLREHGLKAKEPIILKLKDRRDIYVFDTLVLVPWANIIIQEGGASTPEVE